jgi:hypothetical protein
MPDTQSLCRFPTIELNSIEKANGKAVVVSLSTEEQKAKKEAERVAAIKHEIRQKRGFTHVIDLLIEAKKPIVVHNGFSDLLKIYHQFHAKLPPQGQLFKMCILDLFPLIFDTKYVSTNSPDLAVRENTGFFFLGFFLSLFLSLNHLFISSECFNPEFLSIYFVPQKHLHSRVLQLVHSLSSISIANSHLVCE